MARLKDGPQKCCIQTKMSRLYRKMTMYPKQMYTFYIKMTIYVGTGTHEFILVWRLKKGNWQTVQTQSRCCRVQYLIKVCTVCK